MTISNANTNATVGLLGDTPTRSYAHKLHLFNAFAQPELQAVIAGLALRPGQRALDAGCGVGLACAWFQEAVGPDGLVVGVDLSGDHTRLARMAHRHVVQGDIARLPFAPASFDLVWCSNTLNHARDPIAALRALAPMLRPNGRVVIGQSAFLPEMFFAWDARLESAITTACRQYYRDKYGLNERDLAPTRNVVGFVRQAGLTQIQAQTVVIERTTPLTAEDEAYFVECVFNGYWGHKVRPYLDEDDWHELTALCDPASPAFCLRRDDFHHIQTYTVVTGVASDNAMSKL
jgi:SAM-dependent methyltransferase